MTIEKAKEEKSRLERRIAELVRKYEIDTGAIVNSVSVGSYLDPDYPGSGPIYTASVKVSL